MCVVHRCRIVKITPACINVNASYALFDPNTYAGAIKDMIYHQKEQKILLFWLEPPLKP